MIFNRWIRIVNERVDKAEPPKVAIGDIGSCERLDFDPDSKVVIAGCPQQIIADCVVISYRRTGRVVNTFYNLGVVVARYEGHLNFYIKDGEEL